jgi:D-tyrosyl-tRNA(Tyr) deacylase
MRVLVQRVASARVEVGGVVSGSIGAGLLVLAGVEEADNEADVVWLSAKLTRLRIFPDEAGVMNRSVIDIGGDVLAVSQFTLFASVRKGNRPSWSRAARPEISQPLFDRFVRQLEGDLGRKVPTGVFGADMQVHLVNAGPVTIAIDSRNPE